MRDETLHAGLDADPSIMAVTALEGAAGMRGHIRQAAR
jgi:hypothetical protein